ncbi:hypothetical protein GCM10027174_38850 [Salinifilum aidingensis]
MFSAYSPVPSVIEQTKRSGLWIGSENRFGTRETSAPLRQDSGWRGMSPTSSGSAFRECAAHRLRAVRPRAIRPGAMPERIALPHRPRRGGRAHPSAESAAARNTPLRFRGILRDAVEKSYITRSGCIESAAAALFIG